MLSVMDRYIDAMQRQRTHRQALALSLALEDALLDKLKVRARLALHPPQPSVAHVRVIEAAVQQAWLHADCSRSSGWRAAQRATEQGL